jgi:hypothetical protein
MATHHDGACPGCLARPNRDSIPCPIRTRASIVLCAPRLFSGIPLLAADLATPCAGGTYERVIGRRSIGGEVFLGTFRGICLTGFCRIHIQTDGRGGHAGTSSRVVIISREWIAACSGIGSRCRWRVERRRLARRTAGVSGPVLADCGLWSGSEDLTRTAGRPSGRARGRGGWCGNWRELYRCALWSGCAHRVAV